MGETLTWAPLAILAVVIIVFVVLHFRKERRIDDEATAYAEADAAATTE